MGATQSMDTEAVIAHGEVEKNLNAETKANPPSTKIISTQKIWDNMVIAVDFHMTEPWILTYQFHGYFLSYLYIWNYDTKTFPMMSVRRNTKSRTSLMDNTAWAFNIIEESVVIGGREQRRLTFYESKSMGSLRSGHDIVSSIKFIDRKDLLVTGSANNSIHVYEYRRGVKKITSITSFRARGEWYSGVTSLAVHPTKPYLLSACDKDIQLWDWDKNWECIQTYPGPSSPRCHLVFNPNDTNSFACTSKDGTVEFWSLDSLKPKYTLFGHSGPVICLDFFSRDDQQYLITGATDKTSKIWDLQTQACIHTLEGFKSDVSSVFRHPTIPVLIASTKQGDIHLWSAKNFRLQSIVKMGKIWFGRPSFIGRCNISSNTVVVGYELKLRILEIHNEEPDAGQGSNQNYE